MGHYASEMQCDICGKLRCVCPPSPDKTANHWVVYQDKIWKAKDVESAHGYRYRAFLTHHPKKKDALEELQKNREATVKSLRTDLDLAERRAYSNLPTTADKVKVYEQLLHDIQLFAEVTMDGEKVRQLIGNICRWSYAHRAGNGENSEEEQLEQINKAFEKLRNR